jgi:OsmC-like protein
MSAEQLRAIQSPLKQQYKDDPSSAPVTLRGKGRASADLSCNVETVKGLVAADPHPAIGGDGTLACSGNMLLEALVACSGVTLRAVATAMEIELRDAVITAEGDLDFRGSLAISKEAPVGFKNVRLRFELDTVLPKSSALH